MARLSNLLRNIVLWKLLSEIRQSAGRGEQDAAVKPASASGMTEPSEAQQVHTVQQLLCLPYLLSPLSPLLCLWWTAHVSFFWEAKSRWPHLMNAIVSPSPKLLAALQRTESSNWGLPETSGWDFPLPPAGDPFALLSERSCHDLHLSHTETLPTRSGEETKSATIRKY